MHLSDTFAEALSQALWCIKSGHVAYAGYRRRNDFMLLALCTVFVSNRELTDRPWPVICFELLCLAGCPSQGLSPPPEGGAVRIR